MHKSFRGDSDYKASFKHAATCLIDDHIEDREERVAQVQALIDEYVTETGERPSTDIIALLTDYLLHEDLEGDSRTDKINDDYPILSDRQMERRHEREYQLKLVENHDTSGKNWSTPVRRRRTAKEGYFIDKVARLKNQEKKAQYRRDTMPGTVVTYNLRDTGRREGDVS